MSTPQVFRTIDNTPVGSIVVMATPSGALTMRINSKENLPGGQIGITGIVYSPSQDANITIEQEGIPLSIRSGSPVVIVREGAEN